MVWLEACLAGTIKAMVWGCLGWSVSDADLEYTSIYTSILTVTAGLYSGRLWLPGARNGAQRWSSGFGSQEGAAQPQGSQEGLSCIFCLDEFRHPLNWLKICLLLPRQVQPK